MIGQLIYLFCDQAFLRVATGRRLRLFCFAMCLPVLAMAGNNQGRGSILMNPAAAAQMQNAAIGAQIQSAQNSVHNLTQNGVSTFKGSNGVTFLVLKDPTLVPSNVLRTFQSPSGKTYAIDGNGVIFGGSSPVNARALSAAAMGATSNGPVNAEEQKREKPSQRVAPSIVTVEVVRFGEK